MKTVLYIAILIASMQMIHADTPPAAPVTPSAPNTHIPLNVGADKPKVRLQLEMNTSEVEPLGLKQQNLQTEIMTKLIQSDIFVQDDSKNPLLLLRVRTIEADSSTATFIQ